MPDASFRRESPVADPPALGNGVSFPSADASTMWQWQLHDAYSLTESCSSAQGSGSSCGHRM